MEIKKIYSSLKKWNTIIKDKSDNYGRLKGLMDDGSYFKFKQPYLPNSNFIHAYPGIVNGKLKIFLIADIYDRKDQIDNIEKYIEICEVKYEKNIANEAVAEPINPTEAWKRIKSWRSECRSWIPKQAVSKVGFFKCYLIPTEDIKPNDNKELIAYFALKQEANSTILTADLVLKANGNSVLNSDEEEYYDTIKLVPPFRPQEELYLLNAE